MLMDPIRALRIIEGLTLELADDNPKNELYANIYMIAHQAAKPDCAKNHPSFEERALEIEKYLIDSMIIPPFDRSSQ